MLNLKKISTTTFAAISMAATMAMPVLAADGVTATQTLTKEQTSGTATVTYVQESAFTVTIPKAITLDGTSKDATYTVNAKGDINGNQVVKVTPAATFAMSDSHGKADVTATVTQEKQLFNQTELAIVSDGVNKGTDTTGSLIAADLTAGDWSGTLQFTINLDTASN